MLDPTLAQGDTPFTFLPFAGTRRRNYILPEEESLRPAASPRKRGHGGAPENLQAECSLKEDMFDRWRLDKQPVAIRDG
jgi:hypothetical protein